jgi:nucleotide-binding universal stress UspA family protein
VISATVADGDPADELVDIARGAELVVVGTHKTGFVQGKVFGSKFLALVRESATASAFIPDSSGSFRRGVVAPLDVSVRGLVLIRFAAAEAARTSQDLVLVWSSPHPIGASSTSSAPAGAGEPAYIEQLAVASAAARLHNDGLRITGRYERVPLADALLRASSAAAVLVLGIARYDRLSSAAHDRVVFDVLLNIASPVIVIHDETASTADTRPTHQTRPTDQTRPAHENRGEPNG